MTCGYDLTQKSGPGTLTHNSNTVAPHSLSAHRLLTTDSLITLDLVPRCFKPMQDSLRLKVLTGNLQHRALSRCQVERLLVNQSQSCWTSESFRAPQNHLPGLWGCLRGSSPGTGLTGSRHGWLRSTSRPAIEIVFCVEALSVNPQLQEIWHRGVPPRQKRLGACSSCNVPHHSPLWWDDGQTDSVYATACAPCVKVPRPGKKHY